MKVSLLILSIILCKCSCSEITFTSKISSNTNNNEESPNSNSLPSEPDSGYSLRVATESDRVSKPNLLLKKNRSLAQHERNLVDLRNLLAKMGRERKSKREEIVLEKGHSCKKQNVSDKLIK